MALADRRTSADAYLDDPGCPGYRWSPADHCVRRVVSLSVWLFYSLRGGRTSLPHGLRLTDLHGRLPGGCLVSRRRRGSPHSLETQQGDSLGASWLRRSASSISCSASRLDCRILRAARAGATRCGAAAAAACRTGARANVSSPRLPSLRFARIPCSFLTKSGLHARRSYRKTAAVNDGRRILFCHACVLSPYVASGSVTS